MVLEEHAFFEQTLFLYYAYEQGLDIHVKDNGWLSPRDGIMSVCSANYIVARTDFPSYELIARARQNILAVTSFVDSRPVVFQRVGAYRLPDNSAATLYRRLLDCSAVLGSAHTTTREVEQYFSNVRGSTDGVLPEAHVPRSRAGIYPLILPIGQEQIGNNRTCAQIRNSDPEGYRIRVCQPEIV